jgi:hypothetical protein
VGDVEPATEGNEVSDDGGRFTIYQLSLEIWNLGFSEVHSRRNEFLLGSLLSTCIAQQYTPQESSAGIHLQFTLNLEKVVMHLSNAARHPFRARIGA